MTDRIILCSQCGTKNRIPSGKGGEAKCGRCGHIILQATKPKTLRAISIGVAILVALIGTSSFFGRFENDPGMGKQLAKPLQSNALAIFESTRSISRTRNHDLAPFVVKTSGSSDYYLKLVDVFTREIALTAYIKGGDTLTTRAPTGVFELRYAVGSVWYGPTLLFGPNTSYFKADDNFSFETNNQGARGHTVELIKQAGGNLTTRPLSGSQF